MLRGIKSCIEEYYIINCVTIYVYLLVNGDNIGGAFRWCIGGAFYFCRLEGAGSFLYPFCKNKVTNYTEIHRFALLKIIFYAIRNSEISGGNSGA